MDKYQEGLLRNYILRFECQRRRRKWANILQTAGNALWNCFVMAVAACATFWAVVGCKDIAYAERGYDANGGEYILIGLAVIGIVKVANRWMK